MRQMLEEECIAIRASHGQDRGGTPARGGSGTAAAAGGGGGGGGGSSCKKRARVLHTGGPDQSILASMAMHRGEGLQVRCVVCVVRVINAVEIRGAARVQTHVQLCRPVATFCHPGCQGLWK